MKVTGRWPDSAKRHLWTRLTIDGNLPQHQKRQSSKLLVTPFPVEMFLSSLKWSITVFPRRFFSKRSTLPYEVDRFNAARVRLDDWSDDQQLVRDQLSSIRTRSRRLNERTSLVI